MHHGAPRGLILHVLFMHICCFSVQLFTEEPWGITTSIILQHFFFPDVSCSSLSCCAGVWALIAHKLLIKKQYSAKPKWSFANFIVYVTTLSASIYNLFLTYRTVTLLIYLFLLLISKKSLIVSHVFRHGFSNRQHQAQLDPQRAEDGRSPLSPSPLSGVCGASSKLLEHPVPEGTGVRVDRVHSGYVPISAHS